MKIRDMRDILVEIISVVVIMLLSAAFFVGIFTASTQNDGRHCDACGGVWRYEQAVGHMFRTSYIYVCECCGRRIEVPELLDICESTQQDRK